MNLETFQLSAYIISWNKLMDPMQKNHPGAISHLSTSPADPGKILVGFETGLLTLWDLASKKGEARFLYPNVKVYSLRYAREECSSSGSSGTVVGQRFGHCFYI